MGAGSSKSSQRNGAGSSSRRHQGQANEQVQQQQQQQPVRAQQNPRQQPPQQFQQQSMQQNSMPFPPQMYQQQQQNAPLPFRQGSGGGGVQVIQNDILVKKSTIKFRKDGSNWFLEFEFDALKPVVISTYFFVQQNLRFFSQLHDAFVDEKAKFEQRFASCQRFQKFSQQIPLSLETLPSKYLDNKDKFWPIIVQMKRDDINGETKTIFYYLTIQTKQHEFSPILKKQVIEFNNESYEISEIYGVENTDLVHGEAADQKQANMDDCNKECIICMTDLIDTVIMPCKHMCICVECAKTFQQQKKNRLCPVCRKEIESFLRISKQQQNVEPQKQQL